jgi:hypothetical protein
MRTRTIFEAYDRTYRGLDWIIPPKRARQNDKFRAELLRRMDEHDHWREIENRLPKLSEMRGMLKGHIKPEYEGMASEDIVRDIRDKMWGDR